MSRGSSLVERRPEKAGVASSILAPGTTRMRQLFFTKEIYFAMSKIRGFAVSPYGFERELTEVFCEGCAGLLDAVWMRDNFPNACQPRDCKRPQFVEY